MDTCILRICVVLDTHRTTLAVYVYSFRICCVLVSDRVMLVSAVSLIVQNSFRLCMSAKLLRFLSFFDWSHYDAYIDLFEMLHWMNEWVKVWLQHMTKTRENGILKSKLIGLCLCAVMLRTVIHPSAKLGNNGICCSYLWLLASLFLRLVFIHLFVSSFSFSLEE